MRFITHLTVFIAVLALSHQALSDENNNQPQALDQQLAALEADALADKERAKTLDQLWQALAPALNDPMLDDLPTWRRLGRLALAINKEPRPVAGRELAAVVAEALQRLDPDNAKTDSLFNALQDLAGQNVVDRLAGKRRFYLKTITAAVEGDGSAQLALSLLYDRYEVARPEAPVFQSNRSTLHWLNRAIQSNNPEAMVKLAKRHHYAQGVQRDYNRMEELLRRAVDLEHWPAEPELWGMYHRRTNPQRKVDQPVREALAKRAEMGDAVAMHQLALMMRRGRGGPKQFDKAKQLLEAAWQAGIVRSATRIGAMHANGEGGPKDANEAAKWYQRGADKGDPVAQLRLGLLYLEGGNNLKRDSTEAIKWIRLAAEQGEVSAQAQLGAMYGLGMGVPRNAAQSHHWATLAAEQGDLTAAANLGRTYYYGRGVEVDYFEAEKWLLRATLRGDPFAQTLLGQMYRDGKGVEQDDKQAMQWFLKAGKPQGKHYAGLAGPQVQIGWMYAKGQGVKQDDKQAIKWFRLAADQNFGPAHYAIGKMHEDGTGVEQNRDKAIEHYRLAVKRYSKEAKQRLKELGTDQDGEEDEEDKKDEEDNEEANDQEKDDLPF